MLRNGLAKHFNFSGEPCFVRKTAYFLLLSLSMVCMMSTHAVFASGPVEDNNRGRLKEQGVWQI